MTITLAYFTDLPIDTGWLLPLRLHYAGFDDWYRRKCADSTPLWLARDDADTLVGALYYKHSAKLIGHPDGIQCDPRGYGKIGMIATATPGTGFGRALLQTALDAQRDTTPAGYYCTYLPTLMHAARFFARQGFSPFGEKWVKGQRHLVVYRALPPP